MRIETRQLSKIIFGLFWRNNIILLKKMYEIFYSSDSDSEIGQIDDILDMDEDFEIMLIENRDHPKNENYIEDTVEQFSNTEFLENFRLTKNLVDNISVQFEESAIFKIQSGGNGKLTARDQVLIFLWFAGHEAASFRDVADRFNISISSLFRIIRRLIYFLSNLAPQIIKRPNLEEKRVIQKFFQEKNFPGVIGVIDGSHVRIDKPSTDPNSYYNRKKIFFTVASCM